MEQLEQTTKGIVLSEKTIPKGYNYLIPFI